jgi:hypothetical protein
MDLFQEALAAHNIAKSSLAHRALISSCQFSGANALSSSFHFGQTRLQL